MASHGTPTAEASPDHGNIAGDDNGAGNDHLPPCGVVGVQVDVMLARPAVRVGGTVVGTLRCFETRNVADEFDNNLVITTKERAPATATPCAVETQGDLTHDPGPASTNATTLPLTTRISPSPEPVANHYDDDDDPHPHHPFPGRVLRRPVRPRGPTLRDDRLVSLQFQMVGRCRLDPRWYHQPGDYQDLDRNVATMELPPTVSPHDVYFWSTPPVELLSVPERTEGAWRQVRPRPISLGNDVDHILEEMPFQMKHWSSTVHEDEECDRFENGQHLAYTFRIDLPTTCPASGMMPPTMSTAACRYSYAILVSWVLRDQSSSHTGTVGTSLSSRSRKLPPLAPQRQWREFPVTLLTSEPLFHVAETQEPRVHVLAHSNGLPSMVTVTELHELPGKLVVHPCDAALYRNLYYRPTPAEGSSLSMSTMATTVPETMRVTDPTTGRPVCVLTIVGRTLLSAGSRLILKFDFPPPNDLDHPTVTTGVDNHAWLPCYQVCACLKGEERAYHRTVTTSTHSSAAASPTRTKNHIFATAYERMDPACSEGISLQLLVPHDAPCSVKTNRLETTSICVMDFAVEDEPAKPSRGSFFTKPASLSSSVKTYRNLRFELPCPIRHGIESYEMPGDEAESQFISLVNPERTKELKEELFSSTSVSPFDPRFFLVTGIEEELQILSLAMAEQCGLRPTMPRNDHTRKSVIVNLSKDSP